MLRVVRLGSPRHADEGLRLGAVRRPPRGVPKSEYAARDFYDLWIPDLAPSADLVKFAQKATTDRQWATFEKRYRAEMKAPEKTRLLDLLSAMSHHADFSVGCYCEEEARCHRSLLRKLLEERGADVA